ncbi:MAG TPA: polysaccharide deacetylase family protein [Candidatus Limnocylindria bacterium]|nr:polysaccharide deacetylase family protein [Candidatus Limnocylindria bacterium]
MRRAAWIGWALGLLVGLALVIQPGLALDRFRPPGSPPPSIVAPASGAETASADPSPGPPGRESIEVIDGGRPSRPPQPHVPTDVRGVVSHGARDSGTVVLSFDMDGGPRAPEIVRWLIDNRVPATLFIAGRWAETSIGIEVLGLAAQHPELLEVGSHSYGHADFTTLTAAQMIADLDRSRNAIAAAYGQPPRPWFRPPLGAVNSLVFVSAARAGFSLTVLWDTDPKDWSSRWTPATLAEEVVTTVQGGSVVILHLSGSATPDALPMIVAGIRERGFELVNLGGLLGI